MQLMIKSIILLLLFGSMQVEAREGFPEIKLERGEKRFKPLKAYKMDDFHFAHPLVYMDVAEYDVSKNMKLMNEGKYRYIMKIGQVPSGTNSQKNFILLSNALLKSYYFWKETRPLIGDHIFTTLRFVEQGDNRFKAVELLQDIKELLGKIDTPAELHLWIYASERVGYQPYSYKKSGKLYRVRFRTVPNTLGCVYEEWFYYYNSNGNRVKNRRLKHFTIQNCEEIMI